MARPLLGVVILLAALNASAGQERGGATAVVCFDKSERLKLLKECKEDSLKQKVCRIPTELTRTCNPKHVETGQCGKPGRPYYIQKIEVIDYYEAKLGRGMDGTPAKLLEIEPTETREQYLGRLGNRMDRYIVSVTDIISHGASFVNANPILSATAGLPPVLDIGVAPLPDGQPCVFSNLIQQKNTGLSLEVIQDERLMQHPVHSRMSEAIAWGHEMVYAYLRTYKAQETSVGARKTMLYLTTQYPIYTVQKVVDSLLGLKVLPLIHPKAADGYLGDGRREDHVSTFDAELAQMMIHFLDVLEDEYSPEASLDKIVSGAIDKFLPGYRGFSAYTNEMHLQTKEHLYNTMITTFNGPAMMVKIDPENPKSKYELNLSARRTLTVEFFKTLHIRNNLQIL